MKNLLLLVLVLLVCSCADDEQEEHGFPLNWYLYKITTPLSVIEDPETEEIISLSPDSTFTKVYTLSSTYEGSGTYTFVEKFDNKYLVLEYSVDSDVIRNCTGDLIEEFLIVSDEEIQGTGAPCDWPTGHYQPNSR